MALRTQVNVGYWNEGGVFNTALTGANSASVITTCMLTPSAIMSCASISVTGSGVIGIPSGQVSQMSINGLVLKFVSIGAVQPRVSNTSLPLGQKA